MTSANPWILLLVAILFEAGWVIGLRFIEGWSRLGPSALVVLLYMGGLLPLSWAAKTLSPSIVYPVWVGVGIALVFVVDALLFREPVTPIKLVCVGLILIGAVGLKLSA